MVSYLNKIDYIHTRISVPLDFSLIKGSYISSTLRKIVDKKNYEQPKNKQLFDIVSIADVARAYFNIGLFGKIRPITT